MIKLETLRSDTHFFSGISALTTQGWRLPPLLGETPFSKIHSS
jgi:hypothetical protein